LTIDPATLEEVALFHPHQDDWTSYCSWEDNATRVNGWIPTRRATIATLKMNRSQLIRVRRMRVVISEHPPDS
jgi:hypothetical protein